MLTTSAVRGITMVACGALAAGSPSFAQFVDAESPPYLDCMKSLTKGNEAQGASVACSDPGWSLKQMRIQEAHDLLRRQLHQKPGAGIVIGQVDTGYTLHPAIKAGLDLANAVNVLKPKDSALDTFSKGILGALTFGKLWNPANRDPSHGTKTASIVIGDPEATKRPAETGWVAGVAPAVKFIPVRGSKGPALGMIGQVQAAKAICYLAGGVPDSDSANFCKEPNPEERAGLPIPPLGRPVDVITISRAAPVTGPVPLRRQLDAALRYARNKGVIIVAASGDYESLTVYPAEACSVVSVSATIVTGAAWKPGSPHANPDKLGRINACDQQNGLKIDISAPGAGVWRAATAKRPGRYLEEDPFRYGAGKGTSFATPAVAGIAAMWLQYRPQVRKEYPTEMVPYVFSYVLRNHGARSASAICSDAETKKGEWNYDPNMVDAFCMERGTKWDPRYGAGIADALGVLTAPLPEAAEVCADLQSRGGYLVACDSRTPERAVLRPLS